MLKVFAEKMWVKATYIFSAKNIRILYIESAKIVNEMTHNELVKLTTLWTIEPRSCFNQLHILVSDFFYCFADDVSRAREREKTTTKKKKKKKKKQKTDHSKHHENMPI